MKKNQIYVGFLAFIRNYCIKTISPPEDYALGKYEIL